MAGFETFRQVTEQSGPFIGQNPRQPMAHAGPDGLASGRGFESPLPGRMSGKHGLGAAGEFVRQSLAHLMGEGGGAG
jgi:hypothetical protein